MSANVSIMLLFPFISVNKAIHNKKKHYIGTQIIGLCGTNAKHTENVQTWKLQRIWKHAPIMMIWNKNKWKGWKAMLKKKA